MFERLSKVSGRGAQLEGILPTGDSALHDYSGTDRNDPRMTILGLVSERPSGRRAVSKGASETRVAKPSIGRRFSVGPGIRLQGPARKDQIRDDTTDRSSHLDALEKFSSDKHRLGEERLTRSTADTERSPSSESILPRISEPLKARRLSVRTDFRARESVYQGEVEKTPTLTSPTTYGQQQRTNTNTSIFSDASTVSTCVEQSPCSTVSTWSPPIQRRSTGDRANSKQEPRANSKQEPTDVEPTRLSRKTPRPLTDAGRCSFSQRRSSRSRLAQLAQDDAAFARIEGGSKHCLELANKHNIPLEFVRKNFDDFKMTDLDGNGRIDFDEFKQVVARFWKFAREQDVPHYLFEEQWRAANNGKPMDEFGLTFEQFLLWANDLESMEFDLCRFVLGLMD